ncbi:hypothetical protein F5Y13DRAFT_160790 [Hypoxylon sp. FL1857]|nr:hypothetical protein F5Y13DRAFT_160790 [Hypoxylon sp. FL1857]
MNRRDHSNLLDRQNRIVAQILTRFRNMVMAATEPILKTGNILEHAALNRLVMETETAGLITQVEALLALNREIKALWIRGPLRQPGEDGRREAELDEQALSVARLYDQALAMRDEAIRREAAARAQGGAAGASASTSATGGAGVSAGGGAGTGA